MHLKDCYFCLSAVDIHSSRTHCSVVSFGQSGVYSDHCVSAQV